MISTPPPVVLIFAGSDPTGASGLTADVLTCASLGCHPAAALTALTIPSDVGAADALPVDDEWVDDQARLVLQDMPVAAFKVGAVGSIENVQTIAEIVSDYPDVPVVLDPQWVANGGSEWGDAEMISALRELLVPQATVLMLSLAQARNFVAVASDEDEVAERSAADCAKQLIKWGAEFALITDSDSASSQMTNSLFDVNGMIRGDTLPRPADASTAHVRGGSDTLSAAITAMLAHGLELPEAVGDATQFAGATLANAFRVGMASAIPDRMFWAGDDEDEDTDDED